MVLSEKETCKEKPLRLKCENLKGKSAEMDPFHEITGFTLTLLEKVGRTENSILEVWRSKLFPEANVILRPV